MKTKSKYLIGVFIFLFATALMFGQTQSQVPPPAPPFDHAPNLPDLANVLVGQLTKVEKTKLTLTKPEGTEQLVSVDANTKLLGGNGEVISLADFKLGDKVAATVTIKDGNFVATQLAKIPSGPGGPPLLPALLNPSSN